MEGSPGVTGVIQRVRGWLANEPSPTGSFVAWQSATRQSKNVPAISTDFMRSGPPSLVRSRVRHLERNSTEAAAIIARHVDAHVGTGFSIRPGASLPLGVADNVIERWTEWSDRADMMGRLDFTEIQRSAFRHLVRDGESVTRFGVDETRNELALQLLPAEFIDSSVTRSTAVEGVELDELGRASGLWLFDRYPQGMTGLERSRLWPMKELVHLARTDTAGQVRGASWLAPSVGKLMELAELDRTAVVRNKTSALFTAFVYSAEDVLGSQQGEDGAYEASLEPGTLQRLKYGESVEFARPPEDREYPVFRRQLLHAIAPGVGLPYSLLSCDLADANYSSSRLGLVSFQQSVEAEQRRFVATFLKPTFRRWITVEILSGRLPLIDGGVDAYARGFDWDAPAMRLLDPEREVKAAVGLVRAGFASRTQVIRQLGRNRVDVDAELAAEAADADRLGLVLDTDPRRVSQQGQGQQFLNEGTQDATAA